MGTVSSDIGRYVGTDASISIRFDRIVVSVLSLLPSWSFGIVLPMFGRPVGK